MKENMSQSGLQQLGVWLIGEFGELLISGETVEMDNTPINVTETEAIQMISDVMDNYKDKSDKGDIIMQYCLTALSKLTVRFKSQREEIRSLIHSCKKSSVIEIQQRACEFLELLDDKWDDHRLGIFEPMPLSHSYHSRLQHSVLVQWPLF